MALPVLHAKEEHFHFHRISFDNLPVWTSGPELDEQTAEFRTTASRSRERERERERGVI